MVKNSIKKTISVVTGANGFVGSHLVGELIKQQHHVRCIVRQTSNIGWIEGLEVEIIRCGLENVATLREAFQDAQYIFHIAGTTKEKKYDNYHFGNVTLTHNVMKASEGISSIQRIVITSSLAAAAPATLYKPVTEETPSKPISKYGKSKLAMEQMVKTEFSHLPYCFIRPPVVYGARDTEVFLFFSMVNKGLATKVGFDKKQVSLVYMDDLVQGLYSAATQENATHQTYFIASDTILTYQELIAEISKALNKRPMVLSLPHFLVHTAAGIFELINLFQKKAPTLNREKAREMTQVAWTCSSQKAEQELGYQAQTFISKGIPLTIDWYRKEGWLK